MLRLSTGSSVQLTGTLIKSPGTHQSVELQVEQCHVYGPVASVRFLYSCCIELSTLKDSIAIGLSKTISTFTLQKQTVW
jgi:aspartyl/asparaginyl-tRNA synthetase